MCSLFLMITENTIIKTGTLSSLRDIPLKSQDKLPVFQLLQNSPSRLLLKLIILSSNTKHFFKYEKPK